MLKFFIFLIFHWANCIKIDENIEDKALNKENSNKLLFIQNEVLFEPGISKTLLLNYLKRATIIFNIKEKDFIQVNIHGINCKFELIFNGTLMKKLNLDTYSIKIDSNNKSIIIVPLLDKINGQFKENYSKKTCPLSINSYSISNKSSDPVLKLGNYEENYLYLETHEYNSLKISYDIKEVLENSYAGLLFQLNEKSNFLIDITYKNNKYSSSKSQKIYNSTTIFLNSLFLLYDKETKNGGNLSINVKNLDKKTILMKFKIIEKYCMSILDKDALNFGLLTETAVYQYFYTEILNGEEGELILHNKRMGGRLIGQIIDKSDVIGLKDISIYPNKNSNNAIILDYNYNNLKLKFTYEDTSKCINGCYLLITLVQEKSNYIKNELTVFDFTILARFWNYTDYLSQIIDIPLNEYLIGHFEKGSISHHYYSLYIPEDATNIAIQIESKYIDGYYELGRKKINTLRQVGNAQKLDIIYEQDVLTLDVKSKGFSGKAISFAFRPKDYYTNFVSYYFFRVLYTKENETLYYPIDSNFGNLCKPEYSNETNKYYCYLILKNYYDNLPSFAISQINKNEFCVIYVTQIFKNNIIIKFSRKQEYINYGSSNNIDYYLFTFEFYNGELKNIFSDFYSLIEEIAPNIYSYQMFFDALVRLYLSKITDNYTLYYQQIHGGLISGNDGGNRYLKITKKKPLLIALDSRKIFIQFFCVTYKIVSFIKLIYNNQKKEIKEIKLGEALSQSFNLNNFPLYFYLKIKNKNNINILINLKINIEEEFLPNNFEFKGYILDEKTIRRIINGEYITLNSPYDGYYSDILKMGFIRIKENIVNNKNYILIEIKTSYKKYSEDFFSLDLVSKEYNHEIFFLPTDQYMFETFDLDDNNTFLDNKYYINCKSDEEAIIDFSSGFDDIAIEFNESEKLNFTYYDYFGFKRYKFFSCNDNDIIFSIVNHNKRRNAYYIIRYHFYGIHNNFNSYALEKYENITENEYNYTLDNFNMKIDNISNNEKNVNICITNNINVIGANYNQIDNNNSLDFDIFAFLFKINETSKENINTPSILFDNQYLFKTNIKHYYNFSYPKNWDLIFENIPRNQNFMYEMQLHVIAKHNDTFLTPQLERLINLYYEDILIFTEKIDLTNIGIEKNKDENKNSTLIIIVTIFLFIFIILVIFFIFKYVRLKKNNINLEQKMKNLSYSNEVKKNVLIKAQLSSQKEDDSETEFI